MEQIPDAASSLLHYADVKRRAIASRCYRTKVSSSNGQTFSPSQVINIDLPSNVANTYFDMSQSYLLMTVNNTAAAANTLGFAGNSGAYSLIDRVQCITGGSTISDIQQYNVLADALMTQNVSRDWNINVGSEMIGTLTTGSAYKGAVIAGGASMTVALPFMLTALANTTPTRYIPAFSRDMLRFRFYLANTVQGVIGVAAGAPTFTVSSVEAVIYCVELSPDAQELVSAMCGNVYNILCNDFRTSNSTFTGAAAALTHTATLGFSVSSMERLIIVHRNNATITQNSNSIGARSTASLAEFQVLINGQSYPERPILAGGETSGAELQCSNAEALAEGLVAQHALADFGHDSQFAMAAGTTGAVKYGLVNSDGSSPGNTGTFVASVELESMAGKSSSIYSGISTIGAVVMYRGVYTTPAAVTYDLSFFCQSTILLTLDMSPSGLGTYVVSV